MLILITLTTSIIAGYIITKLAWKYHVTQLRLEREKRTANYHTAVALKDALDVVSFGRDYYRAGLIEITRISDADDQASIIARRFLALDEPRGEGTHS